METNDLYSDVAGEYARLLLLLDLARERAGVLGESEMQGELTIMVTAASRRLEQLADELIVAKMAERME